MTEERPIKELLQLMLENQKLFINGLCSWKANLYLEDVINMEESIALAIFIDNNKPSKYSSFAAYKHRNARDGYYWQADNIKPRVKWLKKHISRL